VNPGAVSPHVWIAVEELGVDRADVRGGRPGEQTSGRGGTGSGGFSRLIVDAASGTAVSRINTHIRISGGQVDSMGSLDMLL
jgi:hypothetical protein